LTDLIAFDETAVVDRQIDEVLQDGVRLLAKGEIKSKVELVVAGASRAAVEAVEKAGGKVTVTVVKEVEVAE
jgi:large subunit ribosomal protein L15